MHQAFIHSLLPSKASACELSIVMPCLNEAETIGVCIDKAWAALGQAGIDGEVIVADNGSTDGSQQIALERGARLVPVPERGYGAALIGGFTAARGRYLIMADGDDSYNFSHVPRFLEKLRGGADLVMGNRFQGGIEPGAMPLLHRYLGNPVLSFLGRLIFRADCGDFHCGMRGLSKDAFKRLKLRCTGMEFASEMVVKATLANMKIAETPTTLSPDGRSRAPHLRTWRDGWRHLRFLFLYSPRWLFLYPGIALMLVGLASTVWLLPERRMVGQFSFDVDTLVYALGAVLTGFQAIVFAICAKVYGITHGWLPDRPVVHKALHRFTLEKGLVAGAALTLGGLAAAIYGVHLWRATGFGELNPDNILRITLPSCVAIVIGIESIFASCFLSVLRLPSSTKNSS
ncbi:MAG TPA: glycosyltransferase family 2 protein [Acidobacteriaceae bacterium]|nr:glycosyltransferase family 2 protein [Acidobacteriaceae bacterium]